MPLDPELSVGAVNYEYRLTTTELTVGQWYEFVVAYEPYSRWSPNDSSFLGDSLIYIGPGDIYMTPGAANYPTRLGWRYAAIYCNWLHNGKVNERWAFESGAYDINTFVTHPDGSADDQRTRSPGAKFWIPTQSEWIKGAYYDPNRYGPGQGGYWQSPNGTNETLVSGDPGVGQTNGGIGASAITPAGSYPEVQSPWGL